jgi:hypothetical protein
LCLDKIFIHSILPAHELSSYANLFSPSRPVAGGETSEDLEKTILNQKVECHGTEIAQARLAADSGNTDSITAEEEKCWGFAAAP